MASHYDPPFAWSVVEEQFSPEMMGLGETTFAVGNGYMGVRGGHDEGPVRGSGMHVPCVWENGTIHYEWARVNFPRRSQYVPQGPTWVHIYPTLGGEVFDPTKGKMLSFRRELDMKAGVVRKSLTWQDSQGRQTRLDSVRLVSMSRLHVGAVRYEVTPLNWSGPVVLESALDGRAHGVFEHVGGGDTDGRWCWLHVATKVTKQELLLAACHQTGYVVDGICSGACTWSMVTEPKYVAQRFEGVVKPGQTLRLDKFVGVCSSRDLPADVDADAGGGEPLSLLGRASGHAHMAVYDGGFDMLLDEQQAAWAAYWRDSDIEIEGDLAGQQGIRFCLFNLHWNYGGADERINIGAKGLCDCGYGGLYFWDTETYMVPYLTFAAPAKARNLIVNRYNMLSAARAKAQANRYEGAMYPFVTLDGEECGTPWELALLEQHINAAIPYAVATYVNATGDEELLRDKGAEIVLEQARFWASRVVYNKVKGYVINAVTGPDEYAMVVNNNCYTNRMAQWVMHYAQSVAKWMKKTHPAAWKALVKKIGLKDAELTKWRDVERRMYIPFDKKLGIHPQDDAFLFMDPVDMKAIEKDRPLLHRWPWERLIRSQVLKQPDVVLMEFMLNDQFDAKTKLADYKFYEPKTIHDSSLSPCIHSIMAAELGLSKKAFDYYRMTARLDLDDYNGNANAGIHIACHAGSWMCMINGFAGMRVRDGKLYFDPHLPKAWKRVKFALHFQGRLIAAELTRKGLELTRKQGQPLAVTVSGTKVRVT